MIWIGYFLLSLLVFAILYFCAEFMLSRTPAKAAKQADERHIPVYLLSNGVHTDIVLPVRNEQIDWSTVFPYAHTLGGDTSQNWMAIGWGDKGFYLNTPEWKDLSLKTALVAGFGLGETALHVTYYKQLQTGEHCRLTRVSEKQYALLSNYVLANIEKDRAGQAMLIATNAQYSQDDAFYEAKGAYSLFFSCNTWTNNALKTAQMPAGVWTVFSSGILRHYPL
ncbi:TIGR02117 family protein [Sphingobacterium oryzagri]|uniref:TIGR02117 family protein n=1 Tax=Sphingobacterium oryzagri TaxID=3025669 RepID=A0ABY7WI58_9SPHI|nr:TIGR02117 family protein [Sphingobacterium sp. KACC 22765]WDF69306.1 TIGR02117 family protein [Sphingobacterium sp. KACC 22765]